MIALGHVRRSADFRASSVHAQQADIPQSSLWVASVPTPDLALNAEALRTISFGFRDLHTASFEQIPGHLGNVDPNGGEY
jgi:hypothetical protein